MVEPMKKSGVMPIIPGEIGGRQADPTGLTAQLVYPTWQSSRPKRDSVTNKR